MDNLVLVQELESENLVSFNTKSDGMNILEQHQEVCTIKLWYQENVYGQF